jgi:hypothetical protein
MQSNSLLSAAGRVTGSPAARFLRANHAAPKFAVRTAGFVGRGWRATGLVPGSRVWAVAIILIAHMQRQPSTAIDAPGC